MADDRPYLLHIRDAIDRIRSYTHEGKEAFFTSSTANLAPQPEVHGLLLSFCRSQYVIQIG